MSRLEELIVGLRELVRLRGECPSGRTIYGREEAPPAWVDHVDGAMAAVSQAIKVEAASRVEVAVHQTEMDLDRLVEEAPR